MRLADVLELAHRNRVECIDVTEFISRGYVPGIVDVEESLRANGIPYEIVDKRTGTSRNGYYIELAIIKTPFGYLHCAAEQDANGEANCVLMQEIDRDFWRSLKIFSWVREVD